MSKSESEPEFLSFDVQLWRRDIQTFADTTRLALEAIVDELSNQCSGGSPTRSIKKPDSEVKAATSKRKPERVTQKPVSPQPKKVTEGASSGADTNRLTDLKAKLAERLARK